MTPKEEAQKLERELFSRIPRSMFETWLAAERDEAYRFLAHAVDSVAVHRAQGQVHTIEKLQRLLRQYHAQ